MIIFRARRRALSLTAVMACIVVFSFNFTTEPTTSSFPRHHNWDSVPVATSEIWPSLRRTQIHWRGTDTSSILSVSLETHTSGSTAPATPTSILETNEMRRLIKLFDVKITEGERSSFRNLLEIFMKTVPSTIKYFLYSGSLLGSYRHHGMIPWDDDLDLVVPATDARRLVTSLTKLEPHFILNQDGFYRWKFYHRKASKARRFSWKWPSIDISFYKENRTHVSDSDPSYSRFAFTRSDVFPLGKRPFMGLFPPTPRNTEVVILQTYSITVCVNKHYDHRLEEFVPRHKWAILSCDLLKAIYPFVRREYSSNGTLEMLERNNTRIGEYFLKHRD